MKTLYLLRHAHAESVEHVRSDYDRPLDERGRQESIAVGAYLKEKGITFDYVMCSGALRTRETLEFLRSNLGTTAIEVSENFYNNTEDQILKHMRHVSNEKSKVLFIGHNPGIAFAALKFTTVFPEVLMEGIHPATLIGLHFPVDKWADLEWRQGEIIDVFQPNLPSTESP